MASVSRGDPAGGSAPQPGLAAARSTEREPLDPDEFRSITAAIEREVSSAIVGQLEAVRGALICVVAGGHALLEGVPGLGKTTMARAFAAALDLDYRRVQFTPDLMPADITGTTVLMQDPSTRRACGSSAARCSPTSCSRTRSTAPRRGPRARSWRRCRRAR